GEGTDIQTPAERHEPVGLLLPEICTLDCGSVNFGDQIYVSPATWLREHAQLIKDSGVTPELECFDTGHVRFANQLIQRSEEHTSELQSRFDLVCRLLLEKKNKR